MKKLLVVAGVALLGVLAGAPTALAGDTPCPPNLGAVTVDNVNASAGCELDGTIVRGNVKILSGGSLATFGARIGGNIQTDGVTASTRIDCNTDGPGGCAANPTRVGGNVQVKGTTSTPTPFAANYVCNGTRIRGDLQLEENHAPFVIGDSSICAALGMGTSGNIIRGNLQAQKNVTGGPISVVISNNTIGGNLQCKENSPPASGAPFSNNVGGNSEDECAGLGF